MVEAEAGEVGGEARLGGGHAEVGGKGEAEATTDGVTLHGRNDRRLGLEQAYGFLVEVAAAGAALGLRSLGLLRGGGSGELGPGTEGAALGGEDDGAHVRFIIEGVVRAGDGADEGDIEVVVGRAVNLDGGNVAVDVDRDISGRV